MRKQFVQNISATTYRRNNHHLYHMILVVLSQQKVILTPKPAHNLFVFFPLRATLNGATNCRPIVEMPFRYQASIQLVYPRRR